MMNALGFGPAPNLGNVSVEHENICQRMGNALCGVCFGFVLFLGSIYLLGWNEFNFVRNQAVLVKVGKEAVEAGCTPSAANNGNPVWASCVMTRLTDFNEDQRVTSIGLKFTDNITGAWFSASSQIYQWVEDKSCSSHTTTGGGKEKICTYDYSQEWVSSPVDSNDFYCYPSTRSGCQTGGSRILNRGSIPSALQQTIRASDSQVGMGQSVSSSSAYFLNSAMLGVFESVAVQVAPGQSVSVLPGKQATSAGSGTVQFSSSPGMNTIGDVRTTFTQSSIKAGVTQVSVIAKQAPASSGDVSLRPWDTKLTGTMAIVNWATLGDKSKDEMITDKESENGALVVVLRFVGFLLMVLGLQLVTGPISLMPQVVPCCGEFLGEVVGGVLCCINSLIALALSLLVIGIAWLLCRPLLSFCLLAAAGAAVFGAMALRKKFSKGARQPQVSEPLVQAQAVAPVQQTFQVTCPEGVVPLQLLQIQAPNGAQYQVQIPAGVQPGQVFTVTV